MNPRCVRVFSLRRVLLWFAVSVWQTVGAIKPTGPKLCEHVCRYGIGCSSILHMTSGLNTQQPQLSSDQQQPYKRVYFSNDKVEDLAEIKSGSKDTHLREGKNLLCECGIPNVTGTSPLPVPPVTSVPPVSPVYTCRSVTGRERLRCKENEILTGCSMRTHTSGQQLYGPYFEGKYCVAYLGVAMARCCKIPELRCKYSKGKTRTTSVSCPKDFHLHECSCVNAVRGPCPVSRTNNSCYPDSSISTWRYTACCSHKRLQCYTIVKSGQVIKPRRVLTIACPSGEIMTACNGYNSDRTVHKITITEKNGTSKCTIHPGTGSIRTLVGYATCCKSRAL